MKLSEIKNHSSVDTLLQKNGYEKDDNGLYFENYKGAVSILFSKEDITVVTYPDRDNPGETSIKLPLSSSAAEIDAAVGKVLTANHWRWR